MTVRPRFSIVVPVYNEEDVLPVFLRRLQAALADLPGSYEVIFVDDGSADRTKDILLSAAGADHRLGVVLLSRNFGHQAAISAGLAHASGQGVSVIDGDLQDPPELIPVLLARLGQGCDVVYAVRRSRRGNPLKRFFYWLYYRVLRVFAQHTIPLDAGDFCAMSARVVRLLNDMPEKDRFLRGLRAWIGFKYASVDYDRDERYAGETKYSIGRLMRLAFDGILSASDKPLRFSSLFGFLVSGGAVLFSIYAVAWRLIYGQAGLPGYASIAVGIFFLGGVQLISVGILGEYIARVFNQVKGRPLYVVDQTHNLETGASAKDEDRPGRG